MCVCLSLEKQLLSRHDELKEKARQLLEATKREARDKERIKRQGSKDGDDKEVVNGLRNGDPGSPKKVRLSVFQNLVNCQPELFFIVTCA